MKISKLLNPNTLLIGSIALLAVGLLIFLGVASRIDPLEEAMQSEEVVGMLFVVHQDAEPLAAQALYFHTKTGRMALYDVPRETGSLVASLGRMAPLTDLFNPGNPGPYRELVESLLGQPLDFVLTWDLERLERAVDLVGGVDLFLNESIEKLDSGQTILIPAGSVHLEGPKILDYLQWEGDGGSTVDRSERYQRFFQAFLRQVSDQSAWLAESGIGFFQDLVAPGYDTEGLKLWLAYLGTSDTERIIFQRILGTLRDVEGRNLLFPHFNGNLVREGVQQAVAALGSEEGLAAAAMGLRLEILNGTPQAGLASRTSTVFTSVGIDVARVDNAESQDYERTVVLDRRGNLAAAQRVAQLIRCTNIISNDTTFREGGEADVTLILGTDFDGRYVR